MSGEAGVTAIAAIQDLSASENLSSIQQAAAMSNHADMASKFELSLSNIADTAPLKCDVATQSCRRSASLEEGLSVNALPSEVMVRGPSLSTGSTDQVVSYLDGYSHRAKDFMASVDDAVSKVEPNGTAPASEAPGTSSAAGVDASGALKLMQHSFTFAIETYLISNASSLSTRIFNQLMKEQ